jgi:hypothetical protein
VKIFEGLLDASVPRHIDDQVHIFEGKQIAIVGDDGDVETFREFDARGFGLISAIPTICTSGSWAKISIKAVPPWPAPMIATIVALPLLRFLAATGLCVRIRAVGIPAPSFIRRHSRLP